MAKKKRNLDIHIDTKNIDIDIVRKDGKLNVDVDTKHLDVQLEKDAENVDLKIEGDGKIAEVIGNGIRNILKKRG